MLSTVTSSETQRAKALQALEGVFALASGREVSIKNLGTDSGWKVDAAVFEVSAGQFERQEWLIRADGTINHNGSALYWGFSSAALDYSQAARPDVLSNIINELAQSAASSGLTSAE